MSDFGLAHPARLRNWQSFIYEKIDNTHLSNVADVKRLKAEIDKCYCYEFASNEEYISMLDYLEARTRWYISEAERTHQQRMQEIRENQQKMLERDKQKKLLEQADKDYFVKFGRLSKKRN